MQAIDAWGRGIRGAPRRLSRTIVGEVNEDQVVERSYLKVVRRELERVRVATAERRSTLPSVDARTLDPFAFTEEQLKVASQQIVQCDACGASGRAGCGVCGANGTVRCRQCHGAGSFRNPSTNRMNQCKACKKSGRMTCGMCAGDRTVACRDCGGSGHQLSWLTFKDSVRKRVALSPDGAFAVAHPVLRAERPVGPEDLGAFAIQDMAFAHGQLAPEQRRGSRGIVEAELARVDARLERVVEQQYVRVAVVQRSVTYRMSGTAGTVVLAGNDLTPASTVEAIRPIRRRLWMAGALVVALVSGLSVAWAALGGHGAYYARANSIATLAVVASAVVAIPWSLAFLRSWQGGLRFVGQSKLEHALGGLTAALAVSSIVIASASHPSVSEVDAALVAGDLTYANIVVDALKRRGDPPPEILDAEDRVRLAEAAAATGDARLLLLDRVAARQGSEAATAAAAARADRLAAIRGDIKARRFDQALEAVERWFPASGDPEIREEKARAIEARLADCSDAVCQYDTALQAARAHGTKDRTERLQVTEAALHDSLAVPAPPPKETVDRLREARRLAALAAGAAKLPPSVVLAERMRMATAWAAAERARVPVLGATFEVAAELLPSLQRIDPALSRARIDGEIDIYLSFDGSACRGIYAVGANDHRRLASKEWTLEKLISQAIGRQALKAPVAGDVRRWWDAGFPIVARYRSGDLVEVRIGDASP
ncbi:MAG: hypothetical protein KIT31_01645 [Deltaproteobacteria bacterium]|nr:hypothetical protein [Deltaproteobacteria bacterium]